MGRAFLSSAYYTPPSPPPAAPYTKWTVWNPFNIDAPKFGDEEPVYEAFITDEPATDTAVDSLLQPETESQSDSGASSVVGGEPPEIRPDPLAVLGQRQLQIEAAQAPAADSASPAPAPASLSERRLSAHHLASISSIFDLPDPRRFSIPLPSSRSAEEAARSAAIAQLARHASAMVSVSPARF